MFIKGKATYVLDPRLNQKKKERGIYEKKSVKSASGRRRRAQELRRQQEEQTVKRGTGPQQEYPALESSSQRRTPLLPRH